MTEIARHVHALSLEQWGERGSTMLVGQHGSIDELLRRLLQYAQADSPVIITGETGTGKELFARALYLLSRRRRKPFVSVNCAQYADGHLIASELFGHRRGSFTGAVSDHRGVFVAADGGMVFLDELGELSTSAQAMLLRVLSESEVVPVGDTQPVRVDVRVVAATSRDLRGMVAAGRFRADLYYRLRFLEMRVPPLRERGTDWQLMLDHYLARCGVQTGRRKWFSDDAMERLARYEWPGNVRELRGIVDVGFHTSRSELITPDAFECHLERSRNAVGPDTWRPTAPYDDLAVSPFAPPMSYPAEPPASVGTQRPGVPNGTSGGPVRGVASRVARMSRGEATFWDEVHAPFLERELNRAEVRQIIARGLTESNGSYKDLVRLFGIVEADYLRFMDFLRHHRLKPERTG